MRETAGEAETFFYGPLHMDMPLLEAKKNLHTTALYRHGSDEWFGRMAKASQQRGKMMMIIYIYIYIYMCVCVCCVCVCEYSFPVSKFKALDKRFSTESTLPTRDEFLGITVTF